MESWATLRYFGCNVSHYASLEGHKALIYMGYSAAVVQIYGAATASDANASKEVILRGNLTMNKFITRY